MGSVLRVPSTELDVNDPPSSRFSVFVDDSGAKHRRVRRVGRLVGVGVLAYAVMLMAGVVRPLLVPGVGLPPPAKEDPVEVRTGPSPGRAGADDAPIGSVPLPGLEVVTVTATEPSAGAAVVSEAALAPVPAAPSPPPPPPAPAVVTDPVPLTSPTTTFRRPDRPDLERRSAAATVPARSEAGQGRAAPAPPGAETAAAAPGEPPAEPGSARAAGR